MPRHVAVVILLSSTLVEVASAQTPAPDATPSGPTLSGRVRDVSGAVMQAVVVTIFASDDDEPLLETATDVQGNFAITLPPGEYRVEVAAPAFAPFVRTVTVPAGKPLEVVLDLDAIEVMVDVTADEGLTADPAASLTATTLSGDDLLDLPRDEEELARYLLLLAGGEITGDLDDDLLAGFLIDGFPEGRLPTPDEISQIIIDPNPMSADGRGRPRIEIVTRPGTGRWRRSVNVGFADESLNARTPGEVRKEPRQRRDVEFQARGPLIPNVLEMSVQVSAQTDERAGNSLRAITPAGDLFQGIVQPQQERDLQLGAQLQLNAAHRLDVRFTRGVEHAANRGVGGFTLAERAAENRRTEWALQVGERMFRQNLTNNVRVRIARTTSRQTPVRDGFAVNVADAFNGGGGTSRSSDERLTLRLDDDLRLQRGGWSLQWNGRLQYGTRRRIDQDNYNGTFEFASIHDYCQAIGFAGANCGETERIVAEAAARGVTPVYLDARGRATPITGVPTTYTQAFGNADLALNELSFGTHVQADRRIGEAASLRLGLRYEGTNHSRDVLRFSPTVNVQYRFSPRTTVSAGAQVSFADFGDYERLLRNDGSTYQSELTISSPAFPDPFQGGTVEVGANTRSLWVLDPAYRAPYTVNPQISVTQQVPGNLRLTLSYSGSYGFRQRRTPNINAPYPGTPLPDEILALPRRERQEVIDRMRPFYPRVGNITQIQTTGRSESRTLTLRAQPRGNVDLFALRLSGNVNYTYRAGWDDNDYDNPYRPEWGPSRRDHQVQSQFRIGLPTRAHFANPLLQALARATYEGTNLNVNFRAASGRLYSISSGRDLNGDQSSRDRPVGVARNTEVGPGNWNLDMTLTKDYRLGGGGTGVRAGARGGGTRQRQAPDGPRLRFQARVNNVLNRTQPRAYGSVVTSPLFGLPTGYTGGRTITLSMNVNF